LWDHGVARSYLLWGEEDRLKDEAVSALDAHVIDSDFADFDREVLDVSNTPADTILASVSQAPFGSERRLVVVRGGELLRDRGRSADAELLAEGIPSLPESACLVIVCAAEEEEGKRKTAIVTRLDNAIKKSGAVVRFPALERGDLAQWCRSYAQRFDKKIDGAAVDRLISAAGNELRMLQNELDKLVSYTGDRRGITEDDVAAVVSLQPEDVMFPVVEAITRRQTDRALALLGELNRYDPKPQSVAARLLALLARQYRMLWQAKLLAGKRINPREVRNLPPEIAADLPGEGNIAQAAFRASEMFTLSRSYTWGELIDALDQLLQCDLANKGGVAGDMGAYSADVGANLQLLVMQLTSAVQVSA
jgi:DNA polymerase-3 subunit delta